MTPTGHHHLFPAMFDIEVRWPSEPFLWRRAQLWDLTKEGVVCSFKDGSFKETFFPFEDLLLEGAGFVVSWWFSTGGKFLAALGFCKISHDKKLESFWNPITNSDAQFAHSPSPANPPKILFLTFSTLAPWHWTSPPATDPYAPPCEGRTFFKYLGWRSIVFSRNWRPCNCSSKT